MLRGILTRATRNFDDNIWVKGEEIRLHSDTPLCSYISAHEEEGLILLKFSVTGQILYFEESLDPQRRWEFEMPTISLGSRVLRSAKVMDMKIDSLDSRTGVMCINKMSLDKQGRLSNTEQSWTAVKSVRLTM